MSIATSPFFCSFLAASYPLFLSFLLIIFVYPPPSHPPFCCISTLGGALATMLSTPVAAPQSPPAGVTSICFHCLNVITLQSCCFGPVFACLLLGKAIQALELHGVARRFQHFKPHTSLIVSPPTFPFSFVIQLPFPSVVSSVHILSGDACLAVSTLEFGVTCDDLYACQYDTSISLRNRKASCLLQQPLATGSPSEPCSSSLYTVTPQQPQSCLVTRYLIQLTLSVSMI